MLDLKLIRSDPERVKAALARRGAAEQVDELLGLDARRRELLPRIEGAQAERKTLSKQIGEAKQRGESGEEQMRAVATGSAEARRVPSGLNATSNTLAPPSLSCLSTVPVATSAMVATGPLPSPNAINVPSALNETPNAE